MAMEQEIPLGVEGKLSVKVENKKLIITATHTHASGKASVVVEEDVVYFLNQLKGAIKGNWDDLVIDLAVAALP